MSGPKTIAWGDLCERGLGGKFLMNQGSIDGKVYSVWFREQMDDERAVHGWNVNLMANDRSRPELYQVWRNGGTAFCSRHMHPMHLSIGENGKSDTSFFDCPLCWSEQESMGLEIRERWVQMRQLDVRCWKSNRDTDFYGVKTTRYRAERAKAMLRCIEANPGIIHTALLKRVCCNAMMVHKLFSLLEQAGLAYRMKLSPGEAGRRRGKFVYRYYLVEHHATVEQDAITA